ncbi:MAG: hypothetical protein KFF50_08710 [Desulfatitalea sp.]|nr:hypothetical protein [Desulfatitalea sp.]
MSRSYDPDCRRDPAPCRGARWILIVVITVSFLAPLTVTAVRLMPRSACLEKAVIPWVKGLALSGAALWTAGTPDRHPETVHPAVDLRGCAGLEATP